VRPGEGANGAVDGPGAGVRGHGGPHWAGRAPWPGAPARRYLRGWRRGRTPWCVPSDSYVPC